MEQDFPQCAYPLVLTNLPQVRCVVVGGGRVAERKVGELLASGARPTVVSPTLTAVLQGWLEEGRIEHTARAFEPDDLEGALLVFAATDDRATNAAVAAAGKDCLVNVADDPSAGNFHTVATVRRGDLLLTVSTGGASPALAAHIKGELADRYGAAYGHLAALLRALRSGPARALSPEARTRLWQRLISPRVLAWLAAGQYKRVQEYVEEAIGALRAGERQEARGDGQ